MEESRTIAVQPGLTVSALYVRPDSARHIVLLGHGAGAGMRHAFIEGLVRRLSARGAATFRYQFPYMERGGRRPDPPALLLATVAAAAGAARAAGPGLPLYAGGKSMGGRITSMAAANGTLGSIHGLIFIGYPLHGPGKRGSVDTRSRREHLFQIPEPMLFLQGTRDPLGPIDEVREVCDRLGDRASLFSIPDADHSFHVPKRSGTTDDGVLDDLAGAIEGWIRDRENDIPPEGATSRKR